MKPTLFALFILTLGLNACQNAKPQLTDKEKAIEASVKYLKANLNDPSSYEQVEALADTAYDMFSMTDEFKTLTAKIDSFRNLASIASDSSNKYNDNPKHIKRIDNLHDSLLLISIAYGDSQTHIYNFIDERTKTYKGTKPIGYDVLITYRAKNKLGATVLNKTLFLVGQTFTVLSAKDAN